jgi:hypothetical protein
VKPKGGLKGLRKILVLSLFSCLLVFGLLFVCVLGFTIYHRATTPAAQLEKEDKEDAAKREAEKAQHDTQHGLKEEASPGKTSQIGTPIEVGGFTYTINSIEWKDVIGKGELIEQHPDAEYLVVDLTVMNHAGKPMTVESPQSVDSNGRTYACTSNLFIEEGSELFLKELNPRVQSRGRVAFDVPYGNYSIRLGGDVGGLFHRSRTVPIVVYR